MDLSEEVAKKNNLVEWILKAAFFSRPLMLPWKMLAMPKTRRQLSKRNHLVVTLEPLLGTTQIISVMTSMFTTAQVRNMTYAKTLPVTNRNPPKEPYELSSVERYLTITE